MSYNAKQWRAIRYYINKKDLKPQLSAFPFLRFLDSGGNESIEHITTLEIAYEGHQLEEKRRKSEEAKETKRAKKLEKK